MGDAIDLDDGTEPLPRDGALDGVAHLEAVLLLWIRILVTLGARTRDAPLAHFEPNGTQRARVLEQLVFSEVEQAEVLAPARVRLAAVPVHEVGQELTGVLLWCTFFRNGCNVLEQPLSTRRAAPTRRALRWATRG
jgi:hypothetical protein